MDQQPKLLQAQGLKLVGSPVASTTQQKRGDTCCRGKVGFSRCIVSPRQCSYLPMLVVRMILGGSLVAMPGLAVNAEPSDPAVVPHHEETVVSSDDNADLPTHPMIDDAGAAAQEGADMIASSATISLNHSVPRRPKARPLPPVTSLAAKTVATRLRPLARDPFLPEARWDGRNGTGIWTRGLMAALRGPAAGLAEVVPRDIDTWCPAYATNPPKLRRAFWVGVMSALARHESRHRADAVGGGGLYHGLLQILPGTARGYGCAARDGVALQDPVRNLSCAARIMAKTVTRDRAVAMNDGRWRGIAADWGPMTKSGMRSEMADWTRSQSYCVKGPVMVAPRPPARPDTLAALES